MDEKQAMQINFQQHVPQRGVIFSGQSPRLKDIDASKIAPEHPELKTAREAAIAAKQAWRAAKPTDPNYERLVKEKAATDLAFQEALRKYGIARA